MVEICPPLPPGNTVHRRTVPGLLKKFKNTVSVTLYSMYDVRRELARTSLLEQTSLGSNSELELLNNRWGLGTE